MHIFIRSAQVKSLCGIFFFFIFCFCSLAQSVGIGSASFTPGSMLSIRGNMSVGSTYSTVANSVTNGLIVEGNVGIGTSNPTQVLTVSGSSPNVLIRHTSLANGSVARSHGLTIQVGNVNTTSAPALGKIAWASTDAQFTTTTPKTVAWIGALGRETYNADDDGASALVFATAPANPGTGDTVALERVRIDENGNVGIGTISPAEKLHVSGNIRSSGLTGTGTQIITADANGTLLRSSSSTTGGCCGEWNLVAVANGTYAGLGSFSSGYTMSAGKQYLITAVTRAGGSEITLATSDDISVFEYSIINAAGEAADNFVSFTTPVAGVSIDPFKVYICGKNLSTLTGTAETIAFNNSLVQLLVRQDGLLILSDGSSTLDMGLYIFEHD